MLLYPYLDIITLTKTREDIMFKSDLKFDSQEVSSVDDAILLMVANKMVVDSDGSVWSYDDARFQRAYEFHDEIDLKYWDKADIEQLSFNLPCRVLVA